MRGGTSVGTSGKIYGEKKINTAWRFTSASVFPQILEGYERAVGVMETFQKDNSLKDGKLKELTSFESKGGTFPDLEEELHKFAAMFDRDKARKEGG